MHILSPEVFYPTWDPMQAEVFRRRCHQDAAAASWVSMPVRGTTGPRPFTGFFRRPAEGNERGAGDGPLEPLRRTTCRSLRNDSFRPVVHKSSLTNHLWTHTWIPGASKVSLTETVPWREYDDVDR